MTTLTMKAQFDSVLKRQHLADVASSFSDPDFFDEVPLYSRYKDVEFLREYGDVNQLLMVLALDYLNRVTSEIHATGMERVVAITVKSDDEDEATLEDPEQINGPESLANATFIDLIQKIHLFFDSLFSGIPMGYGKYLVVVVVMIIYLLTERL